MITYSTSFIEFLRNSDCRVAKLLVNAHYALLNDKNSAYRYMVTNEVIDHITFRNDGTISYLPAGKVHKENEAGDWAREGRQNGKPAKVIAKLFTLNALKMLHIKEFECFTNEYKAEYNNEGYSFAVLPNNKVPSVYSMERAEGGGSLNDSCMNGDSKYMDIYRYCGSLKILTLKNEGDELCGRALVWQISDELTIMDRIYVTKDFMYNMFLEYAKKQGWFHKKHYKTYDHKQLFITPEGEEVHKLLTVKTNTDFDKYPYIDTFSYGDDGSLNNYGDGCYEYNHTEGGRTDKEEEDDHEGETYDDINERWISEDDAIYIDRGDRRYRDRYCHVDNCINAQDGNWYYEDDSTIVEVNGRYYPKDSDEIKEVDGEWYDADDVVYSEYDGEDYLMDDCIYSDYHESYLLKIDAVKVGDAIYHKDDVVEVD